MEATHNSDPVKTCPTLRWLPCSTKFAARPCGCCQELTTQRPAGTGLANSILWHAGHCYAVTEWITMQSLGRDPESPAGWFDLFGWNSQPGSTPADRYPPLNAVVALLQVQHTRLHRILASLSEQDLVRPSAEWPDRTVRQMILHAFQDEASHKGEMWLLRKLQGKT